jgi:hypothetical protein
MSNNSRHFVMTIPVDSPEQMEAFQKVPLEVLADEQRPFKP